MQYDTYDEYFDDIFNVLPQDTFAKLYRYSLILSWNMCLFYIQYFIIIIIIYVQYFIIIIPY